MEPSTTQQVTPQHVMDLIPRQSAPQAGAGEHWLVRRLHEERQAADHARLTALLAGADSPLVEAVRRSSATAASDA